MQRNAQPRACLHARRPYQLVQMTMTPFLGMQSGYDRLDSADPGGMGVRELVCSISCFSQVQFPAALTHCQRQLEGRSLYSKKTLNPACPIVYDNSFAVIQS